MPDSNSYFTDDGTHLAAASETANSAPVSAALSQITFSMFLPLDESRRISNGEVSISFIETLPVELPADSSRLPRSHYRLGGRHESLPLAHPHIFNEASRHHFKETTGLFPEAIECYSQLAHCLAHAGTDIRAQASVLRDYLTGLPEEFLARALPILLPLQHHGAASLCRLHLHTVIEQALAASVLEKEE